MTIEEKAVEAYKNASSSEKKLLESIFGKDLFKSDVIDRIQSFEDVLHEHGITAEQLDNQIKELTKDEQTYIKLKLVVSAYNEGWKPNWRDKSERKYELWVKYKDLLCNAGPVAVNSIYAPSSASATIGSRLAFKKREHAVRAGELFIDLWIYWFIEE